MGKRAELPTRLVATQVSESRPGESRLPSLLLAAAPRANRAASETARGRTARGRTRLELGSTTDRDIEANEVHVHIGRIEITAEKAATPAGGKPAPARKSPTLAEYLAKRPRSAP